MEALAGLSSLGLGGDDDLDMGLGAYNMPAMDDDAFFSALTAPAAAAPLAQNGNDHSLTDSFSMPSTTDDSSVPANVAAPAPVQPPAPAAPAPAAEAAPAPAPAQAPAPVADSTQAMQIGPSAAAVRSQQSLLLPTVKPSVLPQGRTRGMTTRELSHMAHLHASGLAQLDPNRDDYYYTALRFHQHVNAMATHGVPASHSYFDQSGNVREVLHPHVLPSLPLPLSRSAIQQRDQSKLDDLEGRRRKWEQTFKVLGRTGTSSLKKPRELLVLQAPARSEAAEAGADDNRAMSELWLARKLIDELYSRVLEVDTAWDQARAFNSRQPPPLPEAVDRLWGIALQRKEDLANALGLGSDDDVFATILQVTKGKRLLVRVGQPKYLTYVSSINLTSAALRLLPYFVASPFTTADAAEADEALTKAVCTWVQMAPFRAVQPYEELAIACAWLSELMKASDAPTLRALLDHEVRVGREARAVRGGSKVYLWL